MKILDTCFVCKTPSMVGSQDGVTCGEESCKGNLPYKIMELKNTLSTWKEKEEKRIREMEGKLSLEASDEKEEFKKRLRETVKVSLEKWPGEFIKMIEDFN